MSEPIICFGQQPCGIFPNRFVFSKIKTARRLQSEIGGRVVFFLHDSDHDPRETCSVLSNRHTGNRERINFEFANKIQKLYSPLYCKMIKEGWKEKTQRCLPNLVERGLVDVFASVETNDVTAFCLEMYRKMGLLEGVEIMRSSDPDFREQAIEVDDYFADVPYEGEMVRARVCEGRFLLHKGGGKFLEVEADAPEKRQISPTRDTRLRWMQSVIHCTHYVAGEGEIKYLNKEDAPEIEYVQRDFIERSGEAYAEIDRSPELTRLLEGAEPLGPHQRQGSFSFRNARTHGPRWSCVGDAACFLDPVFSSGVSFGMLGAAHAADALWPALAEGREAEPGLMDAHAAHMAEGYSVFATLILSLYQRRLLPNLFFTAEQDPDLRRGLTSVLAGDVWRGDNPFQAKLWASLRRRYEIPAYAASPSAAE